MTSIHTLAIRRLLTRRPEQLQTHGFQKFFRKLAKEHAFDFCDQDYLRRVPDAWAYVPWAREGEEHLPGTLYIFEVEDSNPLSSEKLFEYANFADSCDFYSLDVKLFVYDRYCEQEREIDLIEYFWMFQVEQLKAS